MEKLAKPKITFSDTLRFTAYAYGKLIYMRDKGPTEIAGYCVTGTDDPLLVTDFVLIKQECTSVSFDLDPDDLARYQESVIDTKQEIWKSLRILCHTHPPGCSPHPSKEDEDNFKLAFSNPSWAIMLIVAENGTTYCRLKINVGPGVEKLLKVEIDFSHPFGSSDEESWDEEYKEKVSEKTFRMIGTEGMGLDKGDEPLWDPDAGYEDELLKAQDEQEIDCYWDKDGDVSYWDNDDDVWYSFDPITGKWFASDETENVYEIQTPNRPWASKVVKWAEKYAHERDAAIVIGEN